MRLIQVTHEFPPSIGGQGAVVYEISKRLARRGHEVTVLTSNVINGTKVLRSSSDYPEQLDGFTVYRLAANFSLKSYSISSHFLRRLLKTHADLFHTHGCAYFHSDTTALASRIRQKPFVITSHAFYPAIYRFSKIILGIYNSLVEPIEFRAASKCIAVTPYYAKIFQEYGVSENKITVIPNGVDCSIYSNLPDPSSVIRKYRIDEKLITFIGRLDDIKSPALFPFMRAFKRLLRDDPEVKLAIIGPDWGYLSKLKALARNLRIQKSVIFTGKVSEQEKLAFLSASYMGAIVSTNEAASIVLLEFMASGKPVIVSRVGGLPYIVKDGETGLLTDNDSNNMERILRRMLFDEALAKKMGDNAKKTAKSSYSWTKIVEKLENVYMECQG